MDRRQAVWDAVFFLRCFTRVAIKHLAIQAADIEIGMVMESELRMIMYPIPRKAPKVIVAPVARR